MDRNLIRSIQRDARIRGFLQDSVAEGEPTEFAVLQSDLFCHSSVYIAPQKDRQTRVLASVSMFLRILEEADIPHYFTHVLPRSNFIVQADCSARWKVFNLEI